MCHDHFMTKEKSSKFLQLNRNESRALRSERLIPLGEGRDVRIDDIGSPLIVLNFILGSWCPLCMKHLVDLTNTLLKMGQKNFKMIVVTTEKEKPLKRSLEKVFKNGFSSENIFFIPGASKNLLNTFSVRLPIFGFSKPATYLIENLDRVKMLSKGIPNSDKVVCELTTYFKNGS